MPDISIRLSFRPEPNANVGSDVVGATARQIVTGLVNRQQRIEPVYDGSRGGELYRWLVEAAQAAQPLLPLATFALTIGQLLNEVRKLKSDAGHPTTYPPTVVVLIYGDTRLTPPADSDQALLEQLLREQFPDPIEPDRLHVEVQVGAPPLPLPPWTKHEEKNG
jgi:hypothetical protein